MTPGDRARIERTFVALKGRGVDATFVPNRAQALASVLAMIPRSSKVAHGSSTTLIEIGFIDEMKKPDSRYEYVNLHWMKEPDPAKRTRLRAVLTAGADYFLGSVQAVCETGEAVSADQGGSRQVGYVFGPTHVIWVAGINKLVPDVEAGIRRLRETALPLEDARIKSTGGTGSYVGKLVIYERQPSGRTRLVLVGENLGF
jgi:YkgG family uncharacterized protein